jgi:hypothetical protein
VAAILGPALRSRDVDVEFLRSAEGDAIPGIHEQVVACGSGDESRIRQLRLRHGKGRAGRLHLAIDLEVAARRSRAVVVEKYSRLSPSGLHPVLLTRA